MDTRRSHGSIGAARTLVQLLFGTTTPPQQENVSGPSVSAATDQSPAISGVELHVDGAAEATPFDINLIGFEYRHRSDPVGQTPGYAAAVAGDSTRPHYGIGGSSTSRRAPGPSPPRLTSRSTTPTKKSPGSMKRRSRFIAGAIPTSTGCAWVGSSIRAQTP